MLTPAERARGSGYHDGMSDPIKPLLIPLLLFASIAAAQSPPLLQPPPTPGVFDSQLRITPGPLHEPSDQRLAVRDADGNRVISRYHIGVGETRILQMPDGRLRAYEQSEVQPTDEAFVPLSNDELRDRYLAEPQLQALGFKAIQSRRFLFLYNSSDRFIGATRSILESMFPAVVKYFGRSSLRPTPPEHPLVVLAFATEEQYQEFKQMPEGVVAYYDTLGNQVVMYEQSTLSQNAPEIAIKNAISTIAHEGVHQMLHNIGVQRRLSRWPMWLSEGLPEYFAPTEVSRRAKWSGLGAVNELRMFEIQKDLYPDRPEGPRPGMSIQSQVDAMMRQAPRAVPIARRLGGGQILQQLVRAEQLESIDYAYSWGLIHMLARRHRDELFDCIAEASAAVPLQQFSEKTPPAEPGSLFEKHFGNDYAKLEVELFTHLKSLPYTDPSENQTHYVVVAGSKVLMTTSPAAVQEMKREAGPAGRFAVRSFPNRTAALRVFDSMTN